jgi:hypothetical protein
MKEKPDSPFLWKENPRPSIIGTDKLIRAAETARRQSHLSKNSTFTTYSKAKSNATTKTTRTA